MIDTLHTRLANALRYCEDMARRTGHSFKLVDAALAAYESAKSAPASHKPFFYALADNGGRPVMDEGCVNTDAEELTSQHQSAIDDLLVKIVPVYTGPQIEAMRDALEKKAAPAEPDPRIGMVNRMCDQLITERDALKAEARMQRERAEAAGKECAKLRHELDDERYHKCCDFCEEHVKERDAIEERLKFEKKERQREQNMRVALQHELAPIKDKIQAAVKRLEQAESRLSALTSDAAVEAAILTNLGDGWKRRPEYAYGIDEIRRDMKAALAAARKAVGGG